MNIAMLPDFLEANCPEAELIRKRVSVNAAKCLLFVPAEEGKWPVLAVFPAGKRVFPEKISGALGLGELRQPGERETYGITGYEKGFLPPVSIYGVKVLVEKSLLGKSFLHFPAGEELTLKISPEKILELNVEAETAEFLEG